ncbi:hypothetical protein [Nitrosarchaeum sp. AC2]|uniref:hypothetical protein n=1 Tax=Nitrosarchaeum sp. AC2 TaxID=2259673 RepID=UPI002104B6E4|nr:hypothetical protein [Nitrosarchaeum sp. AC2]
MNKKIIFFTLAALVGSLVIAPLQSTEAAPYVSGDGSISKYLTKIKVEQYKKGSPYWSYIVKACATDYPLAVAMIDLKSDVEKITLGVNNVIPKGQCSFYGAVMKANDGKTLGATMILKTDALTEAQSILSKLPSTNQKDASIKRLMELYNSLGFIPKL